MPSSTSQQQLLHHQPQITHAAARLASKACAEKSASIGVPMNIAIVDSSMHLVTFDRLPGAKLTSIDIAINKAFTAAGHRAPTSVYKEAVWPGGAAFGLNNSNGGKFMYVAGGVPITDEHGNVVGAIGCSTGTPAQDEEVAKAGVQALTEALRAAGGGGDKLKAKL